MARKKNTTEDRPIYHAQIQYHCYGEVTRRGDPEDRWDRDDTCSHYDIFGFKVVKSSQYCTLPLLFEPEYDKQYWLVYVSYNTGDSFGHDENGQIEFIGLYRDREVAEENVRRIKEHYQKYDSCVHEKLVIKEEDGDDQVMEYVPWAGYFESIHTVEAIPLTRLKKYEVYHK